MYVFIWEVVLADAGEESSFDCEHEACWEGLVHYLHSFFDSLQTKLMVFNIDQLIECIE
jgi:hypothetical protein